MKGKEEVKRYIKDLVAKKSERDGYIFPFSDFAGG
jgi:hypothetical protein